MYSPGISIFIIVLIILLFAKILSKKNKYFFGNKIINKRNVR